MSIITQREVKEYSPQLKRAVILSVVLSVFAITFVLLIPKIKIKLNNAKLNSDIKSVEKVYNAIQDATDEDTESKLPSGLWDISLRDIETMEVLSELKGELHTRLRVSDLRKLEEDGFKSEAFKGSRYHIWMTNNSKVVHLIVESNMPDLHESIEY